MKLYHGTNQDITTIDPSLGMRHKDFGQGFYLTPEYDTASRMAQKRARLFGGTPTIIEYEFDETYLYNSNLSTLIFPRIATVEWARFIDNNRSLKDTCHNYDIVVGPIANDGIAYLLGRYHEGTKSIEELAKDLQDRFLDMQYMFATAKAVNLLRKERSILL